MVRWWGFPSFFVCLCTAWSFLVDVFYVVDVCLLFVCEML